MKIIFTIITSLFLFTSCGSSVPDTVAIPVKTEKTILALGDSLTAGYGLSVTDSYPSQLEAKLREQGYNYSIQNGGVSGDTSAGLLSRMDWLLEGAAPALAILCIGANDAFQGKDPAEIEKNIRAIIEKLQAKNIPILLAGMKAPLNLGGAYGKQYEAIFPRLTKEYNLAYMDWFLDGVALQTQYNQDDRIHPNKEGYTIVVDNLMEILEGEELVRN